MTQHLIQARSYTGAEEDAARIVRRYMESVGYDQVETDDWGSVIGVVRGQGSGSCLFDAHIDTVPADPSRWQRDPWGGQVEAGRIYGRGASDMKGAAAAAIYAVGQLARTRKSELGTVMVTCTVAEEPLEGAALERILRARRPEAVVIMEATELRVNIGQRGRGEVSLTVHGRSAHSSAPHLGVNAVRRMARALTALEELELGHDPLLGPAILEVTDVISAPYPGLSVVPHACTATFDRRLLVGETAEEVIAAILGRVERQSAADPDQRATAEVAMAEVPTYTGQVIRAPKWAPAWKTDPEHPLVRRARAALRSVGQGAETGCYSFCTNGSASAGKLGIPTIGYGPGREAEAHIVDEFLELEQLYQACAGYQALALALSAMSLQEDG